MDHKTEQDAGLLEQAASMLEGLANDERNRGNCSAAEGAACSAHAIRRLAPAMLRAGRGCLAQIEERDIRVLRDISGFEYGTPLYAGAAPAAVAPQGVKFFSASNEGLDEHDTAEAAQSEAQSIIDMYREEAADGWPEEVDSVCWGVILGKAVERPVKDAPFMAGILGSDMEPVDYVLESVAAPALEAPAAPAAPNGWKLVPVKPTIAMLLAGDHARISTEHQTKPQAAYAAMLAAAPQAPAAPSEGLAADVEAVLTLLEEHEWAEHCTKTALGQRLEAAITEMHNEIHEAEDRVDVADALLKRATELHEKGFMPWVEAEELALSEIGIEEAAIDELIREGTYRAVDEDFFLTGADEIRSFTRAVLVHQGMLHSGLSFAQAAPAAPVVDAGDQFLGEWPRVSGVGRDAESPRTLLLYLQTEASDDELRAIHDALLDGGALATHALSELMHIGYRVEGGKLVPPENLSVRASEFFGVTAVAAKATAVHSDDVAVDRFAVEMKAKLAAARAKGRGGWETCPPEVLSRMLREHADKGDPRDVANFCMFLCSLGQPISVAAPAAPAVDAISDTALLDAMERERIAVIPEFEGPWDAQIFGEDESTLACGSGATPRKAIAEALASLEARKAHDAAQTKEGGA